MSPTNWPLLLSMVLLDSSNFMPVKSCPLTKPSLLTSSHQPFLFWVPLGEYLIVVTGRESVGAIQGKQIYRASSFEIIPLAHGVASLPSQQVRRSKMV